jgi:hypothetical protein
MNQKTKKATFDGIEIEVPIPGTKAQPIVLKEGLIIKIEVGGRTLTGKAQLVQYSNSKRVGYSYKLDPSPDVYGGGNIYCRPR